jgi:AraC-like DNA-binding protein
MTSAIPDVSFPLFGGGSTAAVTDRLRLRLLSLSGTTIDHRWGSSDFAAPYWRIYLNLDDGAEARQGGRAIPFQAGHLYVIPAWLSWAGRCHGRVRHLNASIDLPTLPRERVVAGCDRVLHLGGPGAQLVDGWLALGAELAARELADAAQVARGYALAYAALAAAFTALGARADALLGEPAEDPLIAVTAFIEHHLSTPLPLAGLARVARCSPAELVRRFRTHRGTSPARWVRQRRVAAAADLLRCTALGLDEIAERCGFSDRSRLNRCFTALVGSGPAAWRRRERGG